MTDAEQSNFKYGILFQYEVPSFVMYDGTSSSTGIGCPEKWWSLHPWKDV